MTAVLMIAMASVAFTLMLLHQGREQALAESRSFGAASPLDHAEKILESRLARRQITHDEYERMLSVLHRT